MQLALTPQIEAFLKTLDPATDSLDNLIFTKVDGVMYHVIVVKDPIELATEPGAQWAEPA